MAMEDDSIEWFSPERRGIIPLETFHLPMRPDAFGRENRLR